MNQNGATYSIRAHKRIMIQQLSTEGMDKHSISQYLDCHISTVSYWQNRDNLCEKPRSGRPALFDDTVSAMLIGFYCQTRPFFDSGRWTLRLAAAYLINHPETIGLPISKTSIHRILVKNNLKPHRSRYFLHISDPEFFPKMAHLISLYNNPPKNVYCFDECPGIQVLQRLTPDLQTERTKSRLEEFQYIRHGTTDVFALLNVNTGEVMAQCCPDHTKDTFIAVFEGYLSRAPQDQQLNYIMDNLHSHCCYELCELVARYCNIECPSHKELNTMSKRRKWLTRADKRIILHYTPYHGSWLNQVEYWFGMLNEKCLHETYHSPEDMHHAIHTFVTFWNTMLAKPFHWKYNGQGLQEKTIKRFTAMLDNTIKIDSRMLVKQLNLAFNIAKDYWELVDENVWRNLFEKFSESKYVIEYVITKATKKNIDGDLEYIKKLENILRQNITNRITQAA